MFLSSVHFVGGVSQQRGARVSILVHRGAQFISRPERAEIAATTVNATLGPLAAPEGLTPTIPHRIRTIQIGWSRRAGGPEFLDIRIQDSQ
jgi:hypothetical protein